MNILFQYSIFSTFFGIHHQTFWSILCLRRFNVAIEKEINSKNIERYSKSDVVQVLTARSQVQVLKDDWRHSRKNERLLNGYIFVIKLDPLINCVVKDCIGCFVVGQWRMNRPLFLTQERVTDSFQEIWHHLSPAYPFSAPFNLQRPGPLLRPHFFLPFRTLHGFFY